MFRDNIEQFCHGKDDDDICPRLHKITGLPVFHSEEGNNNI